MHFSWVSLLDAKDWGGRRVRLRYVQPKRDGTRVLVRKDLGGLTTIMTREGKTDFWPMLCHVPAIKEAVFGLPQATALDCELYAEGVQATSVITLAKAADERLRLDCFAVPYLGGYDLRDYDLPRVHSMLQGRWPWITPTRLVGGSTDQALLKALTDDLLQEARDMGMEGWMLKEEHYRGWWKLKPVRTCDLVVQGVTISDSLSHWGKLKAIQVGPYGGRELASVGSGFDREFRHSVEPKSLIGRVAEVAYDSKAANGKLKFPRFVRWRDDKSPERCDGKDVV